MPQIKQVFTVNHPRAVVWDRFQDLAKVAECLPGASLTGTPTATHADGRMTVKLGPVRADFAGAVDIEAGDTTYSGRIHGTGMDKSHGSRAKGDISYRLTEDAAGAATTVTVLVDYTLAGSLAQFARGGIVDAVADQICREFAANLETQLNAEATPRSPAGDTISAAEAPAFAPAKARKTNELNALGLIMAILRRKMQGLFSRA